MTRTEPNKKIEIILFLKKKNNTQPQICSNHHLLLDILSKSLFAKKTENQIIGFNNTSAHK